MSWRGSLYLCLLVFVVTLALIIGWRLSDQAMAVIVGVVAGVAASVPTSLFVVTIALHNRAPLSAGGSSAPAAPPAPPQVIVVHATHPAPPFPPAQRSLTVLPAYAAPEPTALNGQPMGSRQFTIMGDDGA